MDNTDSLRRHLRRAAEELRTYGPREDDYDPWDGYGDSYDEYGGYNGWSDDAINDAFEGDPDMTWNVD